MGRRRHIDGEADFIGRLSAIAIQGEATTVESVIALPWVADGVSNSDLDAVFYLLWISATDADAAARVADMPFLQTLEESDLMALYSLSDTASSADRLADMLSRPMLKDCITDDETLIVSLLRGFNSHLFDKLLDPDATTIERRTVELPLAGEAELAIVRTRPGSMLSMDLLENAVREAESLMGEPLPARHRAVHPAFATGTREPLARSVALLFENPAFGPFNGVNNLGNHIVIHPNHDADARLIAHEVAHYYWLGSADWIDEGMAELTASAIENRRVGTPVNFANQPCVVARSLKAWEELAPGRRKANPYCPHSLGERLFVSLLRTLGEDAFWEGARKLYAASLDADGDAGIEEVRQSFGADADEVIDRWYEGR